MAMADPVGLILWYRQSAQCFGGGEVSLSLSSRHVYDLNHSSSELPNFEARKHQEHRLSEVAALEK